MGELILVSLALVGLGALAVGGFFLRRFIIDYRLFAKANHLMAECNYDEAVQVLDKAIQRNPLMPLTWSNRGISHAELGNFNAAMDDLATAIRLSPGDPDPYFNRARANWLFAQYDDAESDIHMVMELTEDAPTHTARAKALELYEQLRPKTESNGLSSAGGEYLMDKSDELHQQGMQQALRNEDNSAIRLFSQAISLDPSNFDAIYNRGISYAKLERYQEAIADFDQVIQLSPPPVLEALAWLSRGTSNLAIGYTEEAIADFAEVSGLATANDDPAFASSLSEYAEVAAVLSEDANTLHGSSSPASGHAPNAEDSFALFQNGCLAARQGQYETALNLFNRAIQIDPNFADAFYNRAGVRLFVGEPQEALRDLEQAIFHNPKAAHYYHLRGEAHQRLGNVPEAMSDYDRTIAMEPSGVAGILSKGELLALDGQYELAISCYDKAIKLQPNNARCYYLRGLAKGLKGGAFGVVRALSDINTAIAIAQKTGDAETLTAAEQSRRSIRGG